MLQQVCEQIHNFFIQKPNPGTYTISGGVLSPLPALWEGQRFWIVGSALNDGVYTYHAAGITDDDEESSASLMDETFSGSVCGLAVPRAVIDLAKEIKDWNEKYADALNSPYQSEDVIGVYSYEKMTASKVNGGNSIIGWQDQFANRLKPWRKVSL